jgi:hypothetical protein
MNQIACRRIFVYGDKYSDTRPVSSDTVPGAVCREHSLTENGEPDAEGDRWSEAVGGDAKARGIPRKERKNSR